MLQKVTLPTLMTSITVYKHIDRIVSHSSKIDTAMISPQTKDMKALPSSPIQLFFIYSIWLCLDKIERSVLIWIHEAKNNACCTKVVIPTDYGLQMKLFFQQIINFGQINFGAFGIFSADLSAPILVLWVPCPCFPWINHYFRYFYKNLSLYIHLGLGFECGPQKIRDFIAFVCP